MLTGEKTTRFDRIVRRSDLMPLIDELARTRRLVGPVARDDRFFYEEVRQASDLDFAFDYCTYSARNFLFPPTETLFTFDRKNGSFVANAVIDARPLALVGVHPCDVHAIRLLDRVFEMDHRDEHYLARRENTFIVGVDCPRPCAPDVFCGDMHANSAHEGFDVMLYPLAADAAGEIRYGVVIGTDEGRRWVRGGLTDIPTPAERKAFERYQEEKSAAFPRRLTTKYEDLPALLKRSYDSLLWEATAHRCYSCGSCNFVCPTCYCFNIADELSLDGHSGERKREWDSCMLRDFASVAGGHNFRSKTGQRLRHRVFRKAAWISERTGLAGCVGCGRCDRACTAKISIVQMLNQLAEEATDVR